jgi:hypothetical protein
VGIVGIGGIVEVEVLKGIWNVEVHKYLTEQIMHRIMNTSAKKENRWNVLVEKQATNRKRSRPWETVRGFETESDDHNWYIDQEPENVPGLLMTTSPRMFQALQ